MIRIEVKNNQGGKKINAELTDTPASLFEKFEVSTASSQVTLNGRILSKDELDDTLGQLGVEEGSQGNILSAIVKADGANN